MTGGKTQISFRETGVHTEGGPSDWEKKRRARGKSDRQCEKEEAVAGCKVRGRKKRTVVVNCRKARKKGDTYLHKNVH